MFLVIFGCSTLLNTEQVVYQSYYLHHGYLLGYVYLIKRLFLSKNKLLYKTDGWKEQSQPQPHSVVY